MKLIYVTDIHGGFEKLKQLLSETVADVYILAGDLIDIPFYTMETAMRYHELQTFFHALRRQRRGETMILEDFVDDLLDRPDVPEDIQEKGTRYQQYTIRARRVMQQKYKVLENMVALKPHSQIFCLPGNYDMDLKYTALHERDLHNHWHQIEGWRIAGYGGADVWTMGIPERYLVPYQAGIGVDDRHNEMSGFFRAVKPDIIVAHQPAYGVHDTVSSMGPSGSPALRTYCDQHPVALCLSGHIHHACGVRGVERTLYLNPSNFGAVNDLSGDVFEGGFFFLVETAEKDVVKVILKKLVEDRIHDVADYYRREGRWVEDPIDPERYQAWRGRENTDTAVPRYSHIPEIQLYKDLKHFYRMFQTQETEDRLDRLEQVARRIEQKLHDDIAMDVVGSVNVGLSAPNSDIDFVLYLRCDGGCDKNADCSYRDRALGMIRKILNSQYKADVIDCIDLNLVERSIREKNYECEMTQRFVAYRAICRPINYRVIAPIEDLLNQDPEYRKELEGSIRSYFKIFTTTSQHVRSFRKYEARLQDVGIKLPESIRGKLSRYLQEENGAEGRDGSDEARE